MLYGNRAVTECNSLMIIIYMQLLPRERKSSLAATMCDIAVLKKKL